MNDFIVYSEHTKAGIYPEPNRHEFLDEINLRVKRKDVDGTDFEFMIKLVELSGLTLKVEVYRDAFKAFKVCPEVFEILARWHVNLHDKSDETLKNLEGLAKDLEAAGWKRKRPTAAQLASKKKACPTCGHASK